MSAKVIFMPSKRPALLTVMSAALLTVMSAALLADRKIRIQHLRRTEPHVFRNPDQLQSRLAQLGHAAAVTQLDLEGGL